MKIPIIGDLIASAKDLVSEAIVDKDKAKEINLELAKLADEADKRLHLEMIAQTEVNKTEAAHRSIFVAGWRPFIGWVSGGGVAWTFVVGPLVEWVSRLFGWTGTMPELDTSQLMTLVMAMLGVGAMRSFDKKNGVSNDVLKAPVKEPVNLLPASFNELPEDAPWSK